MKRIKLFVLSILVLFCGGLFSACSQQQETILAESIQVVGVGEEGLILRLGESVDVDIVITPNEAVNKNFVAFGYDANFLTVSVNHAEMKATITATTAIEANNYHRNIGFKTSDGSLQTILAVHILDEEKTMLTPQNLQFDGEKFTWSAIEGASAYTMYINDIPHIVSKDNVEDITAYMNLNVSDYEGHQVTAKVKANGRSKNLDSGFSNEISFEIFNKPTNVKLDVAIDSETDIESDILRWDTVENVQSYSININGTLISAVGVNYYDISNYLQIADEYNIRIKCDTNNDRTKFESSYADSIEVIRLSAPNSFNMINGSLRWNNDGNARKYEVSFNYAINGEYHDELQLTKYTSYSLADTQMDAGTYSVKVRAIGDNKTTLRSGYSQELNYTKLDSVKNIRIQNGKIEWDSVPFATNYVLYIKNILNEYDEVQTETASAQDLFFDLNEYKSGKYVGELKINIQPLGRQDTILGNFLSEDIIVKKLATPTNLQSIKINGVSKIQWNSVNDAKKYLINITHGEDTISAFVEPSLNNIVTYEFEEDIIKEGFNIVSVKALGDDTTNPVIINSSETKPITINKLLKPEINDSLIIDGIISWNNLGEAGGYNVVVKNIKDEIILDEIITTSYINLNTNQHLTNNQYALEAGTYKINVKAISVDNQNVYDSEFTDYILLRKFESNIDNKALVVENGTIENLENTENYLFKYIITSKTDSHLNLERDSINDYIEDEDYMEQDTEFYVQTKVVPTQKQDESGIYLVSSNLSKKLYVKRLPTITDLKMIDGILYYGSNYSSITGYEFEIKLDEENINNGTNLFYDLNGSETGDHQVKVRALGIGLNQGNQNQVLDSEKPFNLNSKYSTIHSFTKLSVPENFKISSFADIKSYEEDGETEKPTSISAVVSSLYNYQLKDSGAIVWDQVEGALSYQLIIDNNKTIFIDGKYLYASLQNTFSNLQGTHNVKIKAIGDGINTISSDLIAENVSFKKFNSPNSLEITNNDKGEKVLKWSYASGMDPNADLSNMSSLSDEYLSIAVYVIIDEDGNYYSTLQNGLDFSTIIQTLKSNQCTLPNNLYYKTSIRVIAVPLNSYISGYSMEDVYISRTNSTLGIVSDASPEIYVEPLITPRNFKMNDSIINWSTLLYDESIIDEYRLNFTYKNGDDIVEKYISIKKGNPSQSKNNVIYVESLNSQEICNWEFCKENFVKAFGNNVYACKIYSVYIRTIAKNSYYYENEDSNKKIYYIDSLPSTSLSVEVLANPELRLEKGIIVWEPIKNAEKYRIQITKPSGIIENFETNDGKETTLTLQDDNLEVIKYPAGQYKFKIISLGDGQKTITGRLDESEEKIYTKLQDIQNLRVKNGYICYDKQDTVDSVQNSCKYTLYIRSLLETNDQTYENDKNNIYELDEKFLGGYQYYIRVMATGDYENYINSNLSDYCYVNSEEKILPIKLATPTLITQNGGLPGIVDGKLVWNNVENASQYKINVSGGELISPVESTQITTTYNFSDINNGKDTVYYRVKITAVGGDYCLNSTPRVIESIKKLGSIENFAIKDGYIIWQFANESNYKVIVKYADKEDEIIIDFNSDNANIETIENVKYVQYRLLDYNEGSYNISVINYGGINAISSTQTQFVNFEKLASPSKLFIDKEIFCFEKIENASNYQINIKVKIKNIDDVDFAYIAEQESLYNEKIYDEITYKTLPFIKLEQFIKENIDYYQYTIEGYEITVMSFGSTNSNILNNLSTTYYISSNDSDTLIISKPSKPDVYYNTELISGDDDYKFYGKLSWTDVKDADYYKVYVRARKIEYDVNLSNEEIENDIKEHSIIFGKTLNDILTAEDAVVEKEGYNCFMVSDVNYINVIYSQRIYNFIVVACKDKNGFDSDEASSISAFVDNQIMPNSQKIDLLYNIYDENEFGSIENPYSIKNELEFNVIKYNLQANYKLIDNIIFTKVPSVIGTKNNPFIGGFDGAIKNEQGEITGVYTLSAKNNSPLIINSSNNTFNGLFGVVGEGAKLENFIFSANIYATTVKDNNVEIGMIAVENHGTIKNVTTNGYIGSEYNVDSVSIYNAGIVVYNYGLIEYCLCNANIMPKNDFNDVFAGGIAVYNQDKNGSQAIIKCTGFTGSVKGQYVGGIVANNSGIIEDCYYHTNNDENEILSQNRSVTLTYAGGIVGYMTGGSINRCYVVGNVKGTTISSESVYVGGIAGYMQKGTISNSYIVGCKNDTAIITASGLQGGTVKLGVIVGQISNSVDIYGVVCTKLDTQKVSSAGNVSGVEVAINTTTNSLKSSIEKNIINYSSYYDFSYDYPRLKNAKY